MNAIKLTWVDFLKSMQTKKYYLAVTLTFVQWKRGQNLKINSSIANETTRQFLNRLNSECFGHSAKRKGHCIGSVVTVGKNDPYGKIHAHLALTIPENFTAGEFIALIEKIASRFNWIDQQLHIDFYRDAIWLKYMVNHGIDSLLLDCCNQAKP